MSLFDFFKRKPAPPPEKKQEGPSPDYVFTHVALRQIALADPLQFLAIAASPNVGQFFADVLEDVTQHCGRKPSFDASSVKAHPRRVNSFPCAVIELPEPDEMAFAFMVALVVPVDLSSEQLPDKEQIQARYFTLEKGYSPPDELRTVVGEWDATRHSNYGDGPAPEVDAFVAALEKFV